MKNAFFKNVIKNGTLGYVYQKLIYNQDNSLQDLIFLDANGIFEKIVNLERKRMIRRKASTLGDESRYYLETLKESLLEARSSAFKKNLKYFPTTKKHYNLQYYLPKPNYLVTIFIEIENINDPLLDASGRYKTMVNNMNDCLWILDTDLKFSYISPSSQKVFGYSPEEIMILSLKEFMTPESYKRISEVFNGFNDFGKLALEKNQAVTIDIHHIRKDGREVIVEHMIQLLVGEDDTVQGLMGIARDVTEWIAVKENIRKNKEQLQLILDSTAEGIFGMDLEGYCTFCNQSFLRIFGYESQEEVLEKNIKSLFYYDDDDRLGNVFENDFQNFVEKEIFRRKDNTTFVGEYFTFPQYHNGEIIGAVVTILDITNRIEVEKELRETERSKSVLLQNLPGMAYRCKFDREWTMQFVSDGCFELTGYKPESLINNRDLAYSDIVKPEFRKPIWDAWVEAVKENHSFRYEYMIKTADGQEKWVLEQGQPVYNILGEVEALEGLIIDISEQKHKQEEIEYLSFHDSLTGIYNRIYFDMQVNKYDRAEYLPLSVIVGDINGLKFLNDAVGHQEGDKIIQATAHLLGKGLNEGQVLARTGGDEFGILLPKTSISQAHETMLRLQNIINEYNNSISEDAYKINLALGYGTKDRPGLEFSSVFKIAEDHMYKRKLLQRESSHSSIISSITATMYAKSQETEEHAERIKKLAQMVGKKIGLQQEQLDELALIATLHDIGKVGIDEKILNKPGKLTKDEWKEMKKHPEIGYRIAMASPDLVSVADYILSHHERWDGKGYPRGLKGKEIPLLARIISITDAYDAMRSDRPYRKALTKEEALQEIKNNAGTQFDPEFAEFFVNMMREEDEVSD